MQDIELGKKVFKAASWLAFFNTISQVFSWFVTIVVARILSPDDYGLMALATIFTGYAATWSDLGLGEAIIQKQTITKNEVSSVFWFTLGISTLIAVSCFPISYVTAFIFHEPKIILLAQSVSVVFILNGLQIVPINLLKRDLNFKKAGFVDMNATIISCSFMLIIAHMGGGVWTLMGGIIVRSFAKLTLLYVVVRWTPYFHYSFQEAEPYLKFGSAVALSGTAFYVYDKADRFFAGRAWTSLMLGYYTFALNLSQLPTEKITVLINQVSFPALSRLQGDREEFNKFYLQLIRVTATVVLPLFVGGFLVSEEIINIMLGDKWVPIIFIFKFLCLAQIITSLNAANAFVHFAQGRPSWSMGYAMVSALLMPISFYFAVQYGLNAILVPWFTTYIAIFLAWVYITLRKMGIDLYKYIINIINPIVAALLMLLIVTGIGELRNIFPSYLNAFVSLLILKIIVSSFVYISYMWFFDRDLFRTIRNLLKSQHVGDAV